MTTNHGLCSVCGWTVLPWQPFVRKLAYPGPDSTTLEWSVRHTNDKDCNATRKPTGRVRSD